jgi:cytochrome c
MKANHLPLLFISCALLAMTACGGEKGTKSTTSTEPPPMEELPKGATLIATSDCIGCHKETEKLVGPSYVSVAEKYPDTDENIEYLVDKITKGGSGVWGEVPMAGHPNLSKEDATEMAKYILSLK